MFGGKHLIRCRKTGIGIGTKLDGGECKCATLDDCCIEFELGLEKEKEAKRDRHND